MSVDVVNSHAQTDTEPRYRRVLLVEDEAPLRRVIARNLSGRGIVVREAATVTEALAELRAEVPDLILLDINLPDRTGWDVLRDLKQRGVDVPTIVVSAVRVSQRRVGRRRTSVRPSAAAPAPRPAGGSSAAS